MHTADAHFTALNARRMEMLDKADAPPIQESYPLAVAYNALLDAVKSITTAVEDLPLPPANAHCETVAPGMYSSICLSVRAHTHTHARTHAHAHPHKHTHNHVKVQFNLVL